jgi:UDP-N-acetylmuramyl pentapeptide phosphotransferase/UDP-N-acetylglucosamine-1-phosphate transferase
MLTVVLSSIVIAAVSSWGLVRALIPQLSRQLLDQPNARSSHRQPTPRGGGVAFVLVAATASLLALSSRSSFATADQPQIVLSLIALPLALVGFLDDRHNLPASWRFGVQLATALALILLSPLPCPWLAALPLLVAITAVINFTNFMDGLDGLVGSCLAIAIAAISLKLSSPWPLWALVGALLGFLLWNWSPASVFMGDVGSTFLGAVFAGMVLQARSWPEALGLMLIATPLLADACLCVPRRLLAGQRIFQAHRLHLFQRLHQAGWSHARVSGLYITATAASAVTLLLRGWHEAVALAAVELLVGIWLDQRIAVPFSASLVGTHPHQPGASD